MKRESYQVDVPATVDALRERIVVGNAARFGADANVHTRIAAGYAILVLGAWSVDDSGALQGLNNAYVEAFYPQHSVHLTTTVSCPLTRWRLWQAPMTLAFNTDTWSAVGMKYINEVC